MEGELWGLRAIADFLGWKDERAPFRAFKEEGLPMFKRRHGIHPRKVWFSTTSLVMAWMVSRVRADRQRVLEREGRRPGSAPGLRG